MYAERRRNSGFGVRRLQRIHAQRSSRARRIDEALRAPLAKNPEQWLQKPNRYDIPEVDTPKKSANKQEEKHEETTTRTVEPSPITHREFKERLNAHRYYGVTR